MSLASQHIDIIFNFSIFKWSYCHSLCVSFVESIRWTLGQRRQWTNVNGYHVAFAAIELHAVCVFFTLLPEFLFCSFWWHFSAVKKIYIVPWHSCGLQKLRDKSLKVALSLYCSAAFPNVSGMSRFTQHTHICACVSVYFSFEISCSSVTMCDNGSEYVIYESGPLHYYTYIH